jgi:hypothetical protein
VLDGEQRSASCVAAKMIRAIAIALSKRLRMADGQLLSQQY